MYNTEYLLLYCENAIMFYSTTASVSCKHRVQVNIKPDEGEVFLKFNTGFECKLELYRVS